MDDGAEPNRDGEGQGEGEGGGEDEGGDEGGGPVGHIVLVGLMGTGKTTVGRLLADRLGRPFVDSDEQVQARTGRTVREIWLDDGEAVFRRLEAEALRAALAAPVPSVIAAAGGVVLDPANRAVLRHDATVVWLRAEPDALVIRAADGQHRPMLDDDPRAALRRMATERAPLYDEVADVVIDATGEGAAALALAARIEALVP